MNALAKMTVVEDKMFPRDPGAVAFGVLFPTILLLGLGAIPMLREPSEDFGGIRFVEFWAPSALVVGMVAIGAQHVPILIATYRERGILRRMSTTPVHPGYLLIAQMIVALVSVAASALLLVLSAWLILDVAPPQHLGTFVLAFFIGYAAVLAISMISAALVPSASAATSVGTLIFMALMLFGGAFLPRFLMPDVLVTISRPGSAARCFALIWLTRSLRVARVMIGSSASVGGVRAPASLSFCAMSAVTRP